MNNVEELRRMAGMLAAIAYELHDHEGLSGKASEMLLDFWREFNCYEEGESHES